MAHIHPTAIVSESAQIGQGSDIGPYSVIGPKVKLGRNNRVASHVVIEGNTTIGDENEFFQFSSVGSAPQDLKFKGEDSTLTIGNRNKIREYVTLQPGTAGGGMKTVVGDSNLFMANSHVGHDGIIGNGNVFANSVALAGHVTVGNGVILGGLAAIHQFVRLGDLCMLAGGTMVSKDIPPFCMAQGDRARLVGLNSIGLQRRGVSTDDLKKLSRLYREAFRGEGVFAERLEALSKEKELSPWAVTFLAFLTESERGVTLPRRKRGADGEE